MKKLTFALFAVLLLSLSSCQKNNSSIVGTWTFTDNSITADVVTDNPAVTADIVSGITSNQFAGNYMFTPDGTFTTSDTSGYTSSGTYTISGNKLTLRYTDGWTDIYIFSVNDNTLRFRSDWTNHFQSAMTPVVIVTKVILNQTMTRQ